MHYRAAGSEFWAPATEDALAALLAQRPDAVIIAGGTDVVPAVPGRTDLPSTLVWTGRVAGLADVTQNDSHLSIGGACLAGERMGGPGGPLPGPRRRVGEVRRAARAERRHPGRQPRHGIAGRRRHARPPRARRRTRCCATATAERRIPVASLPSGYRTTVLEAGEYISRIDVPLSALSHDVRAYKVARRFDSDIATLSGAFALGLDGARITTVRVAFGGMSAVVHRASGVEAALTGRDWDASALASAQDALARDYAPIGDHRGSADYRVRAARGLLERWWRQTRPHDPESTAATEVWGAL